MWNRLRVLPFDNVVPIEDQDRSLPEKLEREDTREAILAACVAGCLEWQKRGISSMPERVALAYLDYVKEMDPLRGFVSECCDFGEHYSISRKELFDAYIKHCDECSVQKKYRLSDRRFARLIQARGAREGKISNGVRHWQNITIKGRLY